MPGQYTYDDFLTAVNQSGLMGEFSKEDLDLAQQYPEFGLSILSLKKDYHAATTDEARLLANQAANALRSSYGSYTANASGTGYRSDGKIPGQIDDTLDQYSSFTIPEDPTAAARERALFELRNRGAFSWSPDTDPLFPTYKKQFLREGDRATANALAQASAATGGRPSSYAVTAASQAGDYYASQLNDIIPTLHQQAYNRWVQDYDMDLQNLQALNEQQSIWRQGWQEELGLLGSKLSALQGQDAVDHDRAWNENERDYQRGEAARQTAAEQVAAILQVGGVPSDELLTAAGLTKEYAQGVNAGWQRENAAGQVADILRAGGIPSPELLAAAGLTGEYAQGVNSQFRRAEEDEQRALAQAQVDAILQAGGVPSPELIAASEYSNEYVAALINAMWGQQALTGAAASPGSTGYILPTANPVEYAKEPTEPGRDDNPTVEPEMDPLQADTPQDDPPGPGIPNDEFEGWRRAIDQAIRIEHNPEKALEKAYEVWPRLNETQRMLLKDFFSGRGYDLG